jgi:SAM-dependent methyltransferase
MSDPIALKAYEKLAKSYSEIAESKAENGFIEHPAIRKQIGKVAGRVVLDAGCGPGILSKYLIESGASEVVGFDVSPSMIELAEERTNQKAQLFVADMRYPLSNLTDQYFDIVTSSLAIDYIEDWSVPLSEFRRILKNGGRFIFSVQHPLGAYNWYKPNSAFGVQYVEALWKGCTAEPIIVPDYYRSFEDILNPLVEAGFNIRNLVETKPVDALKEIDPDKYDRYSKFPTFMVIEAVSP